MSIISIRFIHQEDVDRWEKLEAKGKLGPKQKQMLERWRKTNSRPIENVIGEALIESARRQILEEKAQDENRQKGAQS